MSEKLSFFTADSDISSSDSDEDANKSIDPSKVITSVKNNAVSSLPPPLQEISKAKQPEFTTKHIRNDIDWDKNKIDFEELPPKEYRPWETALPTIDSSVKAKSGQSVITLAQQTPLSHVVDNSATKTENKGRPIDGVNAAIEWSKMYDNEGDIPVKRLRPEQIGGEKGFMYTNLDVDKRAYKRAAPTSFQSKEKRKRDMGQSNKDKQFVEEEKRILKQSYDA